MERIMISRLTTFAAIFAVLTTASIGFAASAQQQSFSNAAAARQLPVVQLETVVVTGHRVNLADK
jgi:hypothetical protein